MLGQPVLSVEPIGLGRNSQVYDVTSEAGRYAAKVYFRHPLDGRDRLRVEFSSLAFLRANGLTNVPQPIKADADIGIGIYEFVEGERIASASVKPAEVDAAVEFLVALRTLRDHEGSRDFGPASEACFSVSGFLKNIERRLLWLPNVPDGTVEQQALHTFVRTQFVPALERIRRWLAQSSTGIKEELAPSERTLSPSDFGFHNALRRTGELVFLDFEYFGWDDPAKMVADFLLHPAMSLSEPLKRRLVTGLLSRFEPSLAQRLEMVYPLCGLKWCLILLNEFVPNYRLRREFAQAMGRPRSEVLVEQLAKAHRMLERVLDDHEHFPYCD